MKIDDVLNIEDLHRAAKRRLPKAVFDYIEGGVEDERSVTLNEEAFRRQRLVPRYLVDVSNIDQTTTLFGRSYASAFGVAPTGLGGVFRPGADLLVAEAAAAANIPFALSGLSTTRLEDVAAVAPEQAWFQLYGSQDRKISEDMIRRASDAGNDTLLFTVDVTALSNRERDIRNRFGQPRLPLRLYFEALRHPAWLMGYFRHGVPPFANWAPYSEGGTSTKAVLEFVGQNFPVGDHTWRDLENFRRLWPRKLVIKGIMHEDDAIRAAGLGVDGVLVSNHGGRQLDAVPSPLEVLPSIRAAVGDKVALLLDGGVRRGSDVVVARALGADFVLLGRPFVYGVAAFGLAGAEKAISILQREIELTLKQIGCPSLERVGPEALFQGG